MIEAAADCCSNRSRFTVPGRPTVANKPRKLIAIRLDAKSRAVTDAVDSLDTITEHEHARQTTGHFERLERWNPSDS
jgi:hypothetical protein